MLSFDLQKDTGINTNLFFPSSDQFEGNDMTNNHALQLWLQITADLKAKHYNYLTSSQFKTEKKNRKLSI